MLPRLTLLAALLLLAPIACSVTEDGDVPAPGVRGVLLVTVDTLRADHVGGYGKRSYTPGLDRLAARGVLVENAFTPTPSTGPAHASLFTGLHPWNHRVLNNAVPIGGDFRTLAEAARDHGFRTAAVVSSFVLDPLFGLDRGFDSYVFEPSSPLTWRGEYRAEFYAPGGETTQRAIDWLKQFAEQQTPFFLWVHYFDPHYPYHPPSRFQVPRDEPVDMTGKALSEKIPSFEDLEKFIRSYRGEVRYTDAEIDRLLVQLGALGLDSDTAVVVTADHGEGLGDHAHLGHGANLFNELIRVPLLIRAPGLPEGRRLEGPAQLEDLFPTLSALMGIELPADVDGVNLLPWLRGDVAESPRRAAIGRRKTYDDKPVIFYQWRGDEKWIGELDAKGEVFAADLESSEIEARAGEGMPVWLRERISSSAESLANEKRPEMDPEVERGLRALGYVE